MVDGDDDPVVVADQRRDGKPAGEVVSQEVAGALAEPLRAVAAGHDDRTHLGVVEQVHRGQFELAPLVAALTAGPGLGTSAAVGARHAFLEQ